MTANFCSSSICYQENSYPGYCYSVEIASACGRGLFATACESEALSIIERVNNYPTVKHENKQLSEELEKAKRQIKRLRDKLKVAKMYLGEIAEYDQHPDGMDDPGCADGHCCAEKARRALVAIRKEGGNDVH